jgi:hypothetical protein
MANGMKFELALLTLVKPSLVNPVILSKDPLAPKALILVKEGSNG